MFPQAEHARLAASIAMAWGNEKFDRPPVPFGPFVRGVELHDRGYDVFDTDGIGEVERGRWLAIQRAGFAPRGEEPVVDLIVALHVRRLVSGSRDGAEAAALAEMEEALPGLHAAAGLTAAAAARADRITDLCDSVAFAFCFEKPARGRVEISPRAGTPDTTAVEYTVDGQGGITLDPWPLAVPRAPGIILAYRCEGYPDALEPVAVTYDVTPAGSERRVNP